LSHLTDSLAYLDLFCVFERTRGGTVVGPFSAAWLQHARLRHLDPKHSLQTKKFILWHFLQPVYIRTELQSHPQTFPLKLTLQRVEKAARCSWECNGRLPWSRVHTITYPDVRHQRACSALQLN